MEYNRNLSADELPDVYTILYNAPMEFPEPETGFSDLLRSKIIAVVLKTEEGDTIYNLHSSLLCRESKHLQKSLTWGEGSHLEAANLKIDLVDETPSLFSHFAEYLYQPQWDFKVTGIPDILTLTKLYAMGERLIAEQFQTRVEELFNDNYPRFHYGNSDICDLLSIACESITERKPELPLRDKIFRLAASHLVSLQSFERFQDMLMSEKEYDLARCICLRAGNGPSCGDRSEPEDDDGWPPKYSYSKKIKRRTG